MYPHYYTFNVWLLITTSASSNFSPCTINVRKTCVSTFFHERRNSITKMSTQTWINSKKKQSMDNARSDIRSHEHDITSSTITGADPGFQVRGGALKKIAPSGGRRENFWGISCEKSRFYTKKSYFFQLRREARTFLGYIVWKITILRQTIILFPILGGARAGCAPLWIRPWIKCISRQYPVFKTYVKGWHKSDNQKLSNEGQTMQWSKENNNKDKKFNHK